MNLPGLILDISAAVACTVVMFVIIWRRRAYTSVELAVMLGGFGIVSIAVSVDLLWHVPGLVLGSLALLPILVESLLLLPPPDDLPRPYVLSMRTGVALLAVAMSGVAVSQIGHPAREVSAHIIFDVAFFTSTIILAIAYGRLRPRRRQLKGLW